MWSHRPYIFCSSCSYVMVVISAFFSTVWIPEQWGAESWCLFSRLTACGSMWSSTADGHFQPCLRNRFEGLLQQRSPQLQHRDRCLPASPPAAVGLQHSTYTFSTKCFHLRFLYTLCCRFSFECTSSYTHNNKVNILQNSETNLSFTEVKTLLKPIWSRFSLLII